MPGQITDGTRIRLRYATELWFKIDDEPGFHVEADAGREFIAVDGVDVTERGPHLLVVEPDEYLEDDVEPMLIDDIDAFVVVG